VSHVQQTQTQATDNPYSDSSSTCATAAEERFDWSGAEISISKPTNAGGGDSM